MNYLYQFAFECASFAEFASITIHL